MMAKALHHFTDFTPLLHSVGKDFLTTHDLHFLMIRRTYADGRFAWICNMEGYKKDFFDKKVFIPKDEERISPGHHVYDVVLWDEGLPLSTLTYTKQRFYLYNGIGLYTPFKDFIDYMAVAVQGQPKERPFAFYASILPHLYQFKRDLYKEKILWQVCQYTPLLFEGDTA